VRTLALVRAQVDEAIRGSCGVLTPKTQYSLANAKTYFEEHLCVGDYYTEGETISGRWFGQGAAMLGLVGVVKRDAFLDLCENLNPKTGELLTQRRKTIRRATGEDGHEQQVANRRVFYDFTISPPKSVSILAFVVGDTRIHRAHDRAVGIAMKELERFAETRVRTGGACSDRPTGIVVGAVFQHDTSRALDPHLHSHCILFNATFDPVEERWKALQNHELLLARKYVENVYYHELVRELRGFGYEVENRSRGDFEVQGVPQALCERFSKRHTEIDDKTRKLLAREPEKASGNVDDIRANIARNERSRKMKEVPAEQLHALWIGQMSADERQELAALIAGARGVDREPNPAIAQAAVAWAEEHLFDRKSVVHEHEIWWHALERARGQEIEIAEVHAAAALGGYIRDEENPWRITIRAVLQREWEIVEMAQNGIGHYAALSGNHTVRNGSLAADQGEAVVRILSSRDFMTLFRGGAGTGKSYALREVHQGLHEAGRSVCVIAPQRQQVMDLERDGSSGAQTVSEFLARKQMPTGAVVIVDEAGQLGARQMHELLSHVKEKGGRVIVSGDTRQHGAVEASDALRAIERYSGLAAAELNEIRRQDPERGRSREEKAWIAEYKRAVKDAADGKLAAAFDRLDKAGAVVECALPDQQEQLAREYLALAAGNHSTVVVSQTWSEIHKVNERVRAGLQTQGLIGRDEWQLTALETVDLTNAQKRDQRFYSPDFVLVFNRNVNGFVKGKRGKLVAVTAKGVVVEADNRVRTISFDQLDRVTVCRQKQLALARGDDLQLKANGKAASGEGVANGELVSVERVERDGRVLLQDGRTLSSDYRQFVRGYAVTSHASQGKTVDYVLFSDSTVRAATNAEQWYVTISRGRRGIRIFTSDKRQLRDNVLRVGAGDLALDLTQRGPFPRQILQLRRFCGLTRLRQFAVALQSRVASWIATRRRTAMRREVAKI
jgi:conjugative relaxase-like TrwC/TraI family protein